MDESELRRLEVNFDKDEFILFGEMIDQWIQRFFPGSFFTGWQSLGNDGPDHPGQIDG